MNVRKVFRKYNLEPKEYHDQFFISDRDLQERIVGYADLDEDDTVLEIGAGIGNLTEHMVEKCKVIAIEKHGKVSTVLEHQNFPNLSLLKRDAMRVHLENLDFNKVVSNFPFSISTPLTFKLMKLDWNLAVFIYQKAFADRIVAEPGTMDYSRLSLAMNYYCDTEVVEEIPSGEFYPEPETNAAVVRLGKKDVKEKDNRFWKVSKAAFQHKRKKVKNSLKDSSRFLGIEEDEIKEIEGQLPDKRVYQCSFEDFEDIYRILEEL